MQQSIQGKENDKFSSLGKKSAVNIIKGYFISDIDESDTTTKYYGFLTRDGEWYIMQMTSTTVRYAKGNNDYITNWDNRITLTYDYYHIIF